MEKNINEDHLFLLSIMQKKIEHILKRNKAPKAYKLDDHSIRLSEINFVIEYLKEQIFEDTDVYYLEDEYEDEDDDSSSSDSEKEEIPSKKYIQKSPLSLKDSTPFSKIKTPNVYLDNLTPEKHISKVESQITPSKNKSYISSPSSKLSNDDSTEQNSPKIERNVSHKQDENYVFDKYQNLKNNDHIEERINFINGQKYIKTSMYFVLIDWIIQIHDKYKLDDLALFNTVNIIQRYLKKVKTTTRDNFQLLGITCLYIANKLDNKSYHFTLKDITFLANNIYTEEEILNLEQEVISKLDGELIRTTPIDFVTKYENVNDDEFKTTQAIIYMYVTLLFDYFSKFSSETICEISFKIEELSNNEDLSEITFNDEDPIKTECFNLLKNAIISPKIKELKFSNELFFNYL